VLIFDRSLKNIVKEICVLLSTFSAHVVARLCTPTQFAADCNELAVGRKPGCVLPTDAQNCNGDIQKNRGGV
jgi:hypothetical protein